MTEKRFKYTFEGIEDILEPYEEYKYTLCNKDGFQDLCDMLNELHEENEQLKQQNKELKSDNDIKFWKHQFMMKHHTNQLIMLELAKAIDNGYEVSSEFQKYLNKLKAQDSENREKIERLGI